MALESNGVVTTMPLAPSNGGGFGGFGGDGWWLILLLLCFGGGWGGFGGGFGGYGNAQLSYDFPWLLNGQNAINANTNNGFRDAMINDGIGNIQTSITSGFGDVQNSLCGGFAGVNASIANGFATAESSANARQMANMNQAFANQTAMNQGFNSIASQLASCCCENRMATVQTQNIVQSEGAATRLAIQNQTNAILDKLCQQEIDAYKRENEALRTQVTMQNLAASQAAQTAQLIADNTAQTQYIVNRVAPYPIPAYTVANPVTPATT